MKKNEILNDALKELKAAGYKLPTKKDVALMIETRRKAYGGTIAAWEVMKDTRLYKNDGGAFCHLQTILGELDPITYEVINYDDGSAETFNTLEDAWQTMKLYEEFKTAADLNMIHGGGVELLLKLKKGRY